MRRRRFLGLVTSLVGSAWAGRALGGGSPTPSRPAGREPPGETELPRRRLGRAGLELPILGLGGFHLGRTGSEERAAALVDAALEEGVVFFDNAESYQRGGAERFMGAALRGRRERAFLMTKTHDPETRSADGARRHLEGSLERLGTDSLDLWQLHSVKSPEDVDRAFGPGGAMEAILRAKEEGTVRFVGVTGHVNPRANLRALHWFDRGIEFDTMQFPVNPVDALQLSFQEALLPELERRGVGVIAMKTAAGGRLVADGLVRHDECLRWVWSVPEVDVAVVGMETPEQVRANARAARELSPFSAEEREALLARLRPAARLDLEWYKKERA